MPTPPETRPRPADSHEVIRVHSAWATRDDMADLYGDVLAVWRDWAGDRLEGGPITCGHHTAEEAPDDLGAALLGFWRQPAAPSSGASRENGRNPTP